MIWYYINILLFFDPYVKPWRPNLLSRTTIFVNPKIEDNSKTKDTKLSFTQYYLYASWTTHRNLRPKEPELTIVQIDFDGQNLCNDLKPS